MYVNLIRRKFLRKLYILILLTVVSFVFLFWLLSRQTEDLTAEDDDQLVKLRYEFQTIIILHSEDRKEGITCKLSFDSCNVKYFSF